MVDARLGITHYRESTHEMEVGTFTISVSPLTLKSV